MAISQRHGSARHPDREVAHPRPEAMTDESVAALGKLSEALEVVEQARGLLYGFHRLCGTADRTLQEAVEQFREAGHDRLADEVDDVLVGRDIVDGMWSFELVERYDSQYWEVFRDVERTARERLDHAPPHVFEAEMKRDEQQKR